MKTENKIQVEWELGKEKRAGGRCWGRGVVQSPGVQVDVCGPGGQGLRGGQLGRAVDNAPRENKGYLPS